MFEGKTVIAYSIGFYYEAVKEAIKRLFKIDYLCDKKWDDSDIDSYDGVPIIRRKELGSLTDFVLVIFTCNEPLKQELIKEFSGKGYEYSFAMDLMGARNVTGKEIKEEGQDGVCKIGTNTVYYDETLPDNVTIRFTGFNGEVVIGSNLATENLCLILGNTGKCKIGNNVRLIGLTANVAGATFSIGDDCLFAHDTEARTHDSHFIFDKTTHKRINYPKDVIIGPQVWVAAGARLLPGANIGAGSIVGANAVTSSHFGDHVIIAGNPAKVIRENIIWSKDNSQYANWDCFEQCISDDALKY